LDNANARGEQLRKALRHLQHGRFKHLIRDVRGLGLMNAMEFYPKTKDGLSLVGISKAISATSLKHGLLLLRCSAFESIRFIPPLNVTKEEMDEGIQLFTAALTEVAKTYEKK
jgi:4-aminobutyrate aminotransferase